MPKTERQKRGDSISALKAAIREGKKGTKVPSPSGHGILTGVLEPGDRIEIIAPTDLNLLNAVIEVTTAEPTIAEIILRPKDGPVLTYSEIEIKTGYNELFGSSLALTKGSKLTATLKPAARAVWSIYYRIMPCQKSA